MARGCLWLSINAKQTTSLGKEDISLFISFSFFFGGYINFESREEERGGGAEKESEQAKNKK